MKVETNTDLTRTIYKKNSAFRNYIIWTIDLADQKIGYAFAYHNWLKV